MFHSFSMWVSAKKYTVTSLNKKLNRTNNNNDLVLIFIFFLIINKNISSIKSKFTENYKLTLQLFFYYRIFVPNEGNVF